MTITRLHMSIMILIALVLHGCIAIWFALPTPAPLPDPPPQPLRVSLLAAVAETTVNSTVAISKPQFIPKPKPVPKPVIQEAPLEPQPPVKPAPEPLPQEPQPVKNIPESVQTPEPIQEITLSSPIESSIAPLNTVATVQYGQLFRAWLEKHKIYPRHAQRLRIEGEGILRILIDRTGRIQHMILEKRTGNRLLDKAALEMAQRADPFPPIPENDLRRELEFIVPVVFMLR